MQGSALLHVNGVGQEERVMLDREGLNKVTLQPRAL
jgi:hypothetical protein